jgi:hypothetical protein
MNTLRSMSLVVYLAVSALAAPAAGQCGTERWSVKTGTDSDAASVNLTSPQTMAITDLIALPNPGPDARLSPTEDTVYVVNATLTDYKIEGDSDYHLVLMDDQGNTMIAEIPSPSCVDSSSPFASQISNARSQFDAQFQASSSFQTANVPVQVTGVGFFDFFHHQRGVAPNIIELHPVLDIQFNPAPPTNDFVMTASTSAMHLNVGSHSSATLNVTGMNNGSAPADVHYSVSGLPAGVTSRLAPEANGKMKLELAASADVPNGTYPVTVSGSSKGRVRSRTIHLHVSSAPETARHEQWQYKLISAASENDVLTQANKLGTQGWEMVSVLRGPNAPAWKAFFRRQTVD